MGFWERAWETVVGVGGAVQAPAGFVKDIVFEATGLQDEHDGLIGTLWESGLNRASQAVGGLFGADSGFGAAVNAIPEGMRDPAKTIGGGALRGIETAYREGVGEPISAAVTVASLASRPGDGFGGDWSEFFKGDTWRQAYKIAQHRSPGQAISIALGTKDVLDPEEINEYVGTDFHKISSGLWDAAIQLTVAPDNIAGMGAMAARQKYLVRPLVSAAQKEAYFRGKHWQQVSEFVAKHADSADGTSIIRDRLFKDQAQGDMLAHYLKVADGDAEREKIMRFFMGDLDQLDNLYANQSAIALDLEDVTREMALVKSARVNDGTLFADEFTLANAKHREPLLEKKIAELTAQDADLFRLEGNVNVIGTETRLTRSSAIKQGIVRSDFYQTSPLSKPVRTFTNMRPHRVTDLHRGDASVMLDRQLREAGMAQERRDIWRGRVDAVSPEERGGLFVAAENEAFRTKAKQYGLSKKELDEVIASLDPQRQTAMGILQKAKYGPDGRARISFDDPDGEMVEYPMFLTQTANTAVMVDFKQVDRALRRAGEYKYRRVFGTESKALDWSDKTIAAALRKVDLPSEAMTSIMKVWKPAVLLRPAWTMRVVVLDEQLRKIAKIGALANAVDFMQGGRNLTAAAMKEIWGTTDEGILNVGKARKGGAILGGVVGTATAGPAGGILGAAVGGAGMHALGKVTPAMYRQLEVNGHKVMGAFGAPDDQDAIWRSLNSADDSTREFLNQHESGLLRGMRQTDGWETKRPGQAGYENDWERVVNDQILLDPMARQFVEGKSAEDVADWLRHSPAGAKYRKALKRRAENVDEWAETAKSMVDDLVPDVGDIRTKALSGKRVKHADMDALIDTAFQPSVHGQTIQQVLGRGVIAGKVRESVDKWFHILGTLPTDHLSRNPYFARVYSQEMERRLAGIPAGTIKESTLRKMEDSARNAALRETRDLLYDFAERSEFSDLMRNVIPFFPAFQEVLTRWAGLAVENPVFASRAVKALTASSELPEDGVSLLGVEASWYKNDRGDGFLQFRLPDWAKGLVNHGMLKGAVDSQGYVRFDPKAFSMVGSGTPGFGPFVQIAASEIVKRKPDLESSVKFVLPFGVQGEWLDVFLPAAGKRLASLSGEDENRAYANAYYRIITTKLTDMREGVIPIVNLDDAVARGKFLEDVKDETNKFFQLRTVAAWFSPVTPMFDSPYQAQIDAYREMRLADPQSADERFLAQYGEEFFALTQSFTKSQNGIPPTLEGLATEQKFGDLIQAFPEFGALIAGAEGSGMTDKFSRAVYDRQLSSETVEGSGIMQRERFAAEDIVTNPGVRLAWTKFSRAMDAIEAARIERGLPNLRVKGAEDLAEAKRQVVNNLASQYPAWADEYFTVDLDKWKRKIEGLTAITNNADLAGRPAIAGLRTYLQGRQQFVNALAARESTDITSRSNMDLAFAWDSFTARLASEPAFGDLYQRFLSTDPLDVPTIRKAA